MIAFAVRMGEHRLLYLLTYLQIPSRRPCMIGGRGSTKPSGGPPLCSSATDYSIQSYISYEHELSSSLRPLVIAAFCRTPGERAGCVDEQESVDRLGSSAARRSHVAPARLEAAPHSNSVSA